MKGVKGKKLYDINHFQLSIHCDHGGGGRVIPVYPPNFIAEGITTYLHRSGVEAGGWIVDPSLIPEVTST